MGSGLKQVCAITKCICASHVHTTRGKESPSVWGCTLLYRKDGIKLLLFAERKHMQLHSNSATRLPWQLKLHTNYVCYYHKRSYSQAEECPWVRNLHMHLVSYLPCSAWCPSLWPPGWKSTGQKYKSKICFHKAFSTATADNHFYYHMRCLLDHQVS